VRDPDPPRRNAARFSHGAGAVRRADAGLFIASGFQAVPAFRAFVLRIRARFWAVAAFSF